MQQFQKANAEGIVKLVYHHLTIPNKIINLGHVFSTPALLTFEARSLFIWRLCYACMIFSSISGPYSLNAISTPLSQSRQ